MCGKYFRLFIKFLFWDFPRYEEENQDVKLTGYAKELENAYHNYILARMQRDA